MMYEDANHASEAKLGGLGRAGLLQHWKLWKLELRGYPSISRSPKDMAECYSKIPNLASLQVERARQDDTKIR